jgi:hypothetical protein
MIYKALKIDTVSKNKTEVDGKKPQSLENKTDDTINNSYKDSLSPTAEKNFGLDLNSDSILNGIILSEILGKPKCLRKAGGKY